jgi:hypothetical protein
VAGVTPVLCPWRSCRDQTTFGDIAVGGILSSSPGSGSPRWNRQPAAGAAGPLAGAGLSYLMPWRLLGRQPAYSAALGIPLKSSPRHQEITSFPTEALGATNAEFEPSWILHRPDVQFGSSFTKKQDPQSMLD